MDRDIAEKAVSIRPPSRPRYIASTRSWIRRYPACRPATASSWNAFSSTSTPPALHLRRPRWLRQDHNRAIHESRRRKADFLISPATASPAPRRNTVAGSGTAAGSPPAECQ